MKRLLFIPLIFLCSALWAADGPALCMPDSPAVCGKEPLQLARMNPYLAGAGVAAGFTGYIGTNSVLGTDTTANPGYYIIQRYQATATSGSGDGELKRGYFYHNGSGGTETIVGVCVYSSSSSTPQSGDSRIGCTSEITAVTNDWASGDFPSGTVTAGNYYWIFVCSQTTGWQTKMTATSSEYYKATVDCTAPSTLGSGWSEYTNNYPYSLYVTVEP